MNTITGYQLRHHLATEHGIELRGLAYADMAAIHDDDHRGEPGHTHSEAPGDE